MAKILVVEDEADLAKLVRIALEREHHLVEISDNGADALAHLQVNKFDVVILDLMLPALSGMEVCRRYRQSKGKTPILMLTAKGDVNDKEAGLDAGADDYLTKPFHLKELSARVRALIRRSSNLANNLYHLRDIEIVANEFRVTKGG